MTAHPSHASALNNSGLRTVIDASLTEKTKGDGQCNMRALFVALTSRDADGKALLDGGVRPLEAFGVLHQIILGSGTVPPGLSGAEELKELRSALPLLLGSAAAAAFSGGPITDEAHQLYNFELPALAAAIIGDAAKNEKKRVDGADFDPFTLIYLPIVNKMHGIGEGDAPIVRAGEPFTKDEISKFKKALGGVILEVLACEITCLQTWKDDAQNETSDGTGRYRS